MQPQRRIAAVAAGVLLGVCAWPASPPAVAAETATVAILHAVPGTAVDVYLDGNALLQGFRPGSLTDPLSLPAGAHDLKLVRAGAAATAPALVEAADVDVPGGANLTVVAHLGAGGSPELTPYLNDLAEVPAGQVRLTARHVAAAPAIDLRVGSALVFRGLSAGEEKTSASATGAREADAVLSGSLRIVARRVDLPLRPETTTIVYVWGSTQDGLQLSVQSIDDVVAVPRAGVPGGITRAPSGDPVLLVLLAIGVVGAVGATAGVRRSRIPAWLDSNDNVW